MSMCVYLHIYTMSQIYKFNLLSQFSVTCMSVLKLSDNPITNPNKRFSTQFWIRSTW